MIILIPAYEPDEKLIDLIEDIERSQPGQRIVIVDDGSGPTYFSIFQQAEHLGCEIVSLETNMGKGYALRRGFALIADRFPGQDVVTADCDGQHRIVDITKVANEVAERPSSIVLGSRAFNGDVPFRSRFGNSATKVAFRLATGISLGDTQTGLRGYPSGLLGWLGTVGGDRFEYELDVLLQAKRRSVSLVEVPIETVYIDDNESSHFRPIQDSVRVYLPLMRFALSSVASFALDATLFFALMALTSDLLTSVVIARLISATINFKLNHRFVFQTDGGPRAAVRYAGLAGTLMLANYALMNVLVAVIGAPLIVAKAVTELTMFLASYKVQSQFVFDPAPTDPDAVLWQPPPNTQLVGAATAPTRSTDVESTTSNPILSNAGSAA